MKYAGDHMKDKLRNILLESRSQIESFGVVKLGFLEVMENQDISSITGLKLLLHFQHEKKTLNNFLALTYVLEEITDSEVQIMTPESLSEINKQAVLDKVVYIFGS